MSLTLGAGAIVALAALRPAGFVGDILGAALADTAIEGLRSLIDAEEAATVESNLARPPVMESELALVSATRTVPYGQIIGYRAAA